MWKAKKIISSSIIFEFGTQHKKRIEDWFKKHLQTTKVIAHTRSYEVALSMVEAELGVVVLPALTAVVGSDRSYNVNLYKTNLLERRLVSLAPKQFQNVDPCKSFVNSLRNAGKKLKLPEIKESPKFLNDVSENK